MRIIKYGEPDGRVLVRFGCHTCGCVFIAGPHEYYDDGGERRARCPLCGCMCEGEGEKG